MPEVTKASRVSYTKEDVERESMEEQIQDGIWVACVIDEWVSTEQDPTKGEGPGVDLIGRVKLTILNPANTKERTKWALYHRLTLPLRHPDYMDTHQPPSWAKRSWLEFVRAADSDKHPDEPRYNKPDKTWYFKGKPVERDQVEAIKKELVEPALDAATVAYNDDGKAFIGKLVFVLTKVNGDFVNVKTMRDHLPQEGEYMGPAELADKIIGRAAKTGDGAKAKARGADKPASKAKTTSKRRRGRV